MTTLLLSPAPPFQFPEAMEAFLGMLSSLETWIGLTPDLVSLQTTLMGELGSRSLDNVQSLAVFFKCFP